MSTLDLHNILKTVFGYENFRGDQEKVIRSVLAGRDNLVIMPTGGGKSMCYQLPALIQEGLTVVISPLIALMNDQVAALKQLDIPAETLHSNVPKSEAMETYEALENNLVKLLYVSPERLLSDSFLYFLQNRDVRLFAIDEAHCVSIWGNDFRPEYVELARLKELFQGVPTVALTATADAATQKDIVTQLQLHNPQIFLSSFERPNLHIDVKPGIQRMDQINYFLNDRHEESGIIYCLSRKSTEQMANKLRARGLRAEAYHAGLDAQKRLRIQEAFQNDDIHIVCATIAFGMGIDKPNIRWVIHYNMPKNIEGYYQEIGRGGRDNLPANALLFYSWADFLNLRKFIEDSPADETFKGIQMAKLNRMWAFATATNCRTNLILSYFGEFRDNPCKHCDNCLNPPELFDGSLYAQMALSAIARTGQNLGLNLLIDLLRGSYKQEIRSRQLDKVKTFGVGREVPFSHWRHYITQMINQGVLSIDFTDYSKLKLTPLSKDVLKNIKKVELSRYIPPDQRKKARIEKPVPVIGDVDESLLQQLKSWRSDIARQNNVPAYVIMHDKTLVQIAGAKPGTPHALLNIDGIGQAKLHKYGEAILNIVLNHPD